MDIFVRKPRSSETFERKVWKQGYRARKIAAGICPSCAIREPRFGTKICEYCISVRQKYYQKRRDAAYDIIFNRYGEFCQCCGETNREFLSLDHINGGGNAHRKELKVYGGVGFYFKLIKLDLPDGFRTYCHNCNIASYHNGGICPHQLEVKDIMGLYDTPMKDQIGEDSVSKHGTKGGEYDAATAPDVPGRDKSPNGLDELTFDTAATSKSPSTTGIYDTLFKDAVK